MNGSFYMPVYCIHQVSTYYPRSKVILKNDYTLRLINTSTHTLWSSHKD